MPAYAEARPVRPGHHDGGVPSDIGPDPAFGELVTGEPRLALGRDGVDEVGTAQAGDADLLLARAFQQFQHYVPGAGPAAGAHHIVERLQPLPGLVGVDIGELAGQTVADDGVALAS